MKKKRRIKYKKILILIVVILFLCLCFCLKDIIGVLNSNIEQVEILSNIEGYDYSLNENDSEYFKEKFMLLKDELKEEYDEEKYASLVSEEELLEKEVNKLQDPEYIAKYAREKYLYSKDGEYIIKIVEE